MPGEWIEIGPKAVPAYVAAPPQGSGPGLLICHDDVAFIPAAADLFAEEGYVVLAPAPGDVLEPGSAASRITTALQALQAHRAFKGKVGAVLHGEAVLPALLTAAGDLVACIAVYGNPDAADYRLAGMPLVIHATVLQPQAMPAAASVRRHTYPAAAEGFENSGGDGYRKAEADMAYSRTLALLRREIGPQFDLDSLWEAHRACEFVTRDADATMRTMVAEPYVNHVPTMTGGFGRHDLYSFYRDRFIPNNPPDMRNIPLSRTVGADRVVNEGILCFTHDREIDWLLPGVPPTGRYVEVALVGIITFRGDKLVHEHIYWDQASVLVQIGLLDPAGLPVAGREAARKVMDPSLPSNGLLP